MWAKPPKTLELQTRTTQQQELYRVISYAAHALHDENVGLRKSAQQARNFIDNQQTRIQEVTREKERLSSGDSVPVWVVSALDQRLSSAESERDSLTVKHREAARCNTLLTNELDELHKRIATLEASEASAQRRAERAETERNEARDRCHTLQGEHAEARERCSLLDSDLSRTIRECTLANQLSATLGSEVG